MIRWIHLRWICIIIEIIEVFFNRDINRLEKKKPLLGATAWEKRKGI
jgi:hypothetical protein